MVINNHAIRNNKNKAQDITMIIIFKIQIFQTECMSLCGICLDGESMYEKATSGKRKMDKE